MRQTMGGDGSNTTAAVKTYLAAHNELFLADLYLIGAADDPNALWLTSWQKPLKWSVYPKQFERGSIRRKTVSTEIGFKVSALEVGYTPPTQPFTASMDTANPYQRAKQGLYDNIPVRVWKAYMPTVDDADTFGAAPLYGGRAGPVSIQRGEIIFQVQSFLSVVDNDVPLNVIELTNQLAAYQGAVIPAGESGIPHDLAILAGSTTSVLKISHSFSDHVLRGGFVYFNGSPGQTLGGCFSAIADNVTVTGVHTITLYTPLPWAPTPGIDTFFVSAQAPVDYADDPTGAGLPFPFVPAPSSSI